MYTVNTSVNLIIMKLRVKNAANVKFVCNILLCKKNQANFYITYDAFTYHIFGILM